MGAATALMATSEINIKQHGVKYDVCLLHDPWLEPLVSQFENLKLSSAIPTISVTSESFLCNFFFYRILDCYLIGDRMNKTGSVECTLTNN
jgi:hypothetical protein